ncbi:MAG: GAF domain-containing protein [Ignavibacteriales bacterium]|nr:GAF domain-containing protein [Ignavibacteriales bacterium]
MPPSEKKYFGIFSKFLISFLLIALLPLIFFGVLSFLSIQSIGEKIVDDAFLMVDLKTQQTLEVQASNVARRVEKFLRLRENDIITLSKSDLTANKLISFQKTIQSEVWSRFKEKNEILSKKYFLPIYKEISIIDLAGNEILKIINSKKVDKSELKNVSDPQNTKYKSETYFKNSLGLQKGEIYLSHLNGFHISIKEQMGEETELENAISGKNYDGVFRLTTPIFVNNKKTGILVLGIDHIHIMEFTQHILPNSEEVTVFPSYNSGDYAFIFDDEGWIITHPKYWDIKGVDSLGNLIPPYSNESTKEMIVEGRIPFNLKHAGFIHENYPVVAQRILNKENGSVLTTNVGGIKKIMAFAPIHYDKGIYKETGVFGGVTIGAEITKFQIPSYKIKNDIAAALDFILRNSFLFILATFVITVIVAWFVSKHFTDPIIKLTAFSKNLAEGELDQFITMNRNDELGILTDSFNKMTIDIKKGRDQLLYSYRELKQSQKHIEEHALNLEYQLKILKSIQSIGNLLGSTLDLNSILKYILRTCVETVNFDRAILYLLDEKGEFLECKEMHGFTDEEKLPAETSKYNINHLNCIETEVVNTGKIIFVEDFENYPNATITDKKIRKIAKSNSFVFVPLRVKEKIIGILGADKIRSNEVITETDINSLQILANQASRVIENTMLYKEIISQRNFVEDIISNMINGVVSTDGNGIITSINKAAIDILNFNDNSVVGQNIWILLKNIEHLMIEMRNSLIETGIYKGYNVKIIFENEIKYLNINASRVYDNGIHTNSIIIVEDVTERKYLDEKIRNIDRLASIGRFAAGIAHEIRNPLTGLSLFLDDLHDNLGSDQKSYLPMISTALSEIERLDKLIREILDYAVPSKGIQIKSDINELIKSLLILSDKQFEKHNIKIVTKINEELEPIFVDPEKIKQALLNLILNSIHFLPNGGELIIKTNYLKQKKNRFVEIIIEDTGIGFEENEIPNIFDPFYTNREGGTGLGLAITHSIISEHGGTIEASNRKNGGAKFRIKIPCNN